MNQTFYCRHRDPDSSGEAIGSGVTDGFVPRHDDSVGIISKQLAVNSDQYAVDALAKTSSWGTNGARVQTPNTPHLTLPTYNFANPY